jgi:hypothetical protein
MASTKKPSTPKSAPAPAPITVDVSDETLLATRAKALALLAGAGGVEGIRLALAARGYDEDAHTEGWNALHAASSYRADSPIGARATPDAVNDARRALDAWDNTNFPIVSVALKHRFPETHALVFAGDLQPADGAESVVRVKTLLDRLDALPSSHRAALAQLTKRGISPDERARIRALVTTATALLPVDGVGEDQRTAARHAQSQQRDAALRALRAWYEEWSVIARQVIHRRDWLILLGLAARKKPAKPA